MPEEVVPPVVAVVVAHDPGPWFEACLVSLIDEDYPNLSVLVVDAASAEPLAPRVAAVTPDVFIHRLDENRGFGPSANVVTRLVEGSTHFLFCHDDVILEPDCLGRLVEEAFRQNAGIVGPKLVDFEQPDRILQLGLGVDRFGAPVRRVERREFDQSQHDEVREVFAAPGACTLIRSDLFIALGGFDEEISLFGEDVDLCWRAHLAGARVVIVPLAVACHLEATASRRRPLADARALQWRHELRAVLKNYGAARRLVTVAALLVLSVVECVYFAVLGRRERARQVVDAWRWNLAPERHLRAARAQVRAARRVPDRVVGRLMIRGSARLTRQLVPLIEESVARRARAASEGVRSELAHVRHRRDRRTAQLMATVGLVIVIVVLGSRSLIVGHLPVVGELLPFGSPTSLIGHFFGGFQDAGLQPVGPTSPALLLVGVAGIILGGSTGLAIKVGIAIALVAGAVGVARLVRPLGPPSARLWAAVAYLFLPLAWDDVGRGALLALVAYAGMPYFLGRLLRGTGLAPYGSGAPGSRAAFLGECLAFGLLLALLGAFTPLLVALTPLLGVSLAIACALLGELRPAGRALLVAIGSAVTAFVLLLPWSVTFIQRGVSWSVLTGAAPDPGRAPGLGDLVRLDLGPLGAGVLGLAFLAAGLFALVAVDAARFGWATRLWCVLLGSLALAWAESEGWLGSGGGDLQVFVAPVACCIAALVGLGVGAFSGEIRRAHVGWRHIVAIGFAVLLGAGIIPVLGGSLNGRWGLPDSGYDDVLGFANATANAGAERDLWLGDPSILPLPAWQIAPGLALAVSSGGLPDALRLFPSANPGRATQLIAAVLAAERGRTVQLGATLAPEGIRYLVVPTTLGPLLSGSNGGLVAPPPQLLLDALTAQSDLHELPSEGGALVFENTAWRPSALAAGPGSTPSALRVLAAVAELGALLGVGALLFARRRRGGRRGLHASDDEPLPDTPEESAPDEELVGAGERA
jgi:GT2 family glycosyltransferase